MKRALQSLAPEGEQGLRALHAAYRRPQLLSGPDVCLRLGISRMTLWRWVKSGRAPAPVPMVGSGHPRWLVEEIEDFERGRTQVGYRRHDLKVKRAS